ncbi:MAG TPA: lysophospholipid acyltransferase family protein [Sphingobacteriaceae bacterium]
MKLMLKKAHLVIYLAFVIFFFLILYLPLYYFSRHPSRYRKMNHIRRVFGFLTSFSAGMIVRFRYREKIDWSRNYIVCANHTSNLDITAISLMMNSNYAFMGKEELLNNPVTSLFFRTIDIPVNRKSTISAYRAFRRAADYLRQGLSLVIFPEGQIADVYPPELQRFKNGPFRLAIEHQVPVIPVSIRGIWQIMWDDGWKYGTRPGIYHICIHEPICTEGLTLDDTDALRDRVFEIIKTGTDEDNR